MVLLKMKFNSICLVSLSLLVFFALESDAVPVTAGPLKFTNSNCTTATVTDCCAIGGGVCELQQCGSDAPTCVNKTEVQDGCKGQCTPTATTAAGINSNDSSTNESGNFNDSSTLVPPSAASVTVSDIMNVTSSSDVMTSSDGTEIPTSFVEISTTSENPTTDPETENPTVGPPEEQDGTCSGGGFDGASFVGGMVLCAGVAAIGSFIYKYYQSRQEGNYHSLD